jgi:hypothetical protein
MIEAAAATAITHIAPGMEAAVVRRRMMKAMTKPAASADVTAAT